jgi:hypothetical protein
MAYSDAEGVAGQVENEQYCMKKSWNARNVDEITAKMGYHDMSDLANTGRPPTKATGEKANRQMGPESANPSKNDRHGKAY